MESGVLPHRDELLCISWISLWRDFLTPDSWFLIPGAVAERSISLRRSPVRRAGGIGSENADISNVKECERHSRRKSKGSCARVIRAGLAGP